MVLAINASTYGSSWVSTSELGKVLNEEISQASVSVSSAVSLGCTGCMIYLFAKLPFTPTRVGLGSDFMHSS